MYFKERIINDRSAFAAFNAVDLAALLRIHHYIDCFAVLNACYECSLKHTLVFFTCSIVIVQLIFGIRHIGFIGFYVWQGNKNAVAAAVRLFAQWTSRSAVKASKIVVGALFAAVFDYSESTVVQRELRFTGSIRSNCDKLSGIPVADIKQFRAAVCRHCHYVLLVRRKEELLHLIARYKLALKYQFARAHAVARQEHSEGVRFTPDDIQLIIYLEIARAFVGTYPVILVDRYIVCKKVGAGGHQRNGAVCIPFKALFAAGTGICW